jgi:hypothetical protein
MREQETAMRNDIPISRVGQFTYPRDVPICYDQVGRIWNSRAAVKSSKLSKLIPFPLAFQDQQNKTFS